MFYTGIGCREHGLNAQQTLAIEDIAAHLARVGMVLRSGHASGSDYAFEKGAGSVLPNKTSIYLPWAGFRNGTDIVGVNYHTLSDKAFQWARKQLIKSGVMPYFDSMSTTNQAFHARNVFQVLGKEKIKSDFVVYFAPVDEWGKVLGGTRTAVNLARKLGIKTYNLKSTEETFLFCQYLDNITGGLLWQEIKTIENKLRGA